MTDKNTNDNLNIIIGGKNMYLPIYIAKKIPFFSNLLSNEKYDEKEIICLEQSPKFLEMIIEFIRNHYHVDFFKDSLTKEFEEKCIKNNLKYYGLDVLLNNIYDYSPTRKINDRYVVDNVLISEYSHKARKPGRESWQDDYYINKNYTGFVALHNNGDVFENYALNINETIKRIRIKNKQKSIVVNKKLWCSFEYLNNNYVIPWNIVINVNDYYYVNMEDYLECCCPDVDYLAKIFNWTVKGYENRRYFKFV